MDLRIIRKAAIGVLLLMALCAESTILAMAASSQGFATDPASAPTPTSAGSAINSGVSGASTLPIGPSNPVPPNPSLLAVPVIGTAPLTVDFYVGLPNTPGSLIYAWNFGDGAAAYLPSQPFMLHVYQNPGTYLCELELVTVQGKISTIASTKITVKPHPG